MHVGVDKTYWNNSCWLVGIVFTLKKQGVDNVTMSERMHEMSGLSAVESRFLILEEMGRCIYFLNYTFILLVSNIKILIKKKHIFS